MFKKTLLQSVMMAGLTLSLAVPVAAQSEALRQTLFGQVDTVLQQANETNANFLAPQTYAKAADYYSSADEKLKDGRSIESIRKDINKAEKQLIKANEAAAKAKQVFASVLQARDDAQAANAPEFASEQWASAQEQFIQALMKLEDGSEKSAASRGKEAETVYRDAELSAIKANYLDETRRLLAKADDEKVKKYAPETLKNAQALVDQAERSLSENRYDTDEPRSLARQAKDEALHALYLAKILKPVRDKDMSLEQFALNAEKPLTRIASSVDEVARFDQGYAPVADKIINRIGDLQSMANENTDRGYQIIDLKEEIAKLEGELGKQSDRLLAQEEQRQRFKQLDRIFTAEDAEIFTQGQSVLVRLIGLNFKQGSSQIEAQYFDVLKKVQDAIRLFPEMSIAIEGHTDSFGSDDLNLKLSEDRANSVRAYLLANMTDLSQSVVSAIGYGEARPVANNETTEGRARNRRIDVVLVPAS